MQIATLDEDGIQQALHQAYEDKTLRGRKLITVRRIIELRKANGKQFKFQSQRRVDRPQSAQALVQVYKREADRQRLLVKKADVTERRLIFIVSAVKALFADENFLTLLRAEGLEDLPTYLAEKIQAARAS